MKILALACLAALALGAGKALINAGADLWIFGIACMRSLGSGFTMAGERARVEVPPAVHRRLSRKRWFVW